MRHPTDGTLRRLLDEPEGVADAERDHVASCPVCLSGLATAREDADLAAAALAVEVPADSDTAWRRLSRAVADESPAQAPTPSRAPRTRARLRSPVAAAVGVVAVMLGAGAAAANDWVEIFRTEQVAPVAVPETDLVDLPDLTAYGEVEVTEQPDLRQVADDTAAANVTGLPVPQVAELPQGVTGAPVYQVGDRMTAVFTFSADKAARAASAAGESLPAPPPGLDGSRFRLVAGPGVAAVWSSASGLPGLAVARAVAPTAYSSGVAFETARDYLLSLPGMPESVATQLRSFTGDGSTLPLPMPADEVTTTESEVGGVPATVVTSRDGTMAGVVWVDDGIVNAVVGSLSADEVLSVARGLR